MTCNDCIHENVCTAVHIGGEFQENADKCKNFKNKADFVEVCRCFKCRFGDVSIISKTKDGEEDLACYCNLKKVVTDVDNFCSYGERKDGIK